MAMPKPNPNPGDQSPDQKLIEAARNYARLVTGRPVHRITLLLDDNSKRKIDVPATAGFATDWPPPEGWSVRGDRGSRNGEAFRLTGKQLAVFTALVEADDEGLTIDELKRQVWDNRTDDRTVQNTLSRVRNIIRTSLGLGAEYDPIETDGERYRLGTV